MPVFNNVSLRVSLYFTIAASINIEFIEHHHHQNDQVEADFFLLILNIKFTHLTSAFNIILTVENKWRKTNQNNKNKR